MYMPKRLSPARGRTERWLHGVATLAAFLILSGCLAVGPDYKAPEYTVPDLWQQPLVAGLSGGETSLESWWRNFNDPQLDRLIQRAAQGNLSLQQAFARIKEARALRGVATGERYPDVKGSGDLSHQRQSEDFGPLDINRDGTPGTQTDWIRRVGVSAAWEIDFWGRISRSIAAADAEFQASIEDYRDTLVMLYADIAANYVDLRTLQERIQVAARNVEIQQESLRITEARFRAEISPELDVRQAELNLARTESLIPSLRQAAARVTHRLGVLTGAYPTALEAELSPSAAIPQPPREILVGVPTDVVRQRPDIRAAERRLAAQTERIGIVTAELYPTFSLLGDFGYMGVRGDLLDHNRKIYSYGPSVSWNLFNGGRIRNRIHVEDARTAQALAAYEDTVLRALEEVENNLVAFSEERQRRDALQRSVTAAERSVKLVQVLYKSGLTDFQNVLDSERSLAQLQDEHTASVGLVTQNLVQIYRALGGGWQPAPQALEVEIQDAAHKGEPIF
jgi:multidrug efflux system outer membrane protein